MDPSEFGGDEIVAEQVLEPTGASGITFARRAVAQRFGAAVAEKATERFLLAHGMSDAQREGISDVMLMRGGHVATGPPPTVLTFARPDTPAASGAAVDEIRAKVSVVGAIALPAFRQAFIRARREAAHARMGLVYAEVERLSERAWVGRSAMPQSGPTTEVCWLSTSLRTLVDPILVADAAADPDVIAIDVPERLIREVAPMEPGVVGQAGGPVGVVMAAGARMRMGVDGSGVLVAVIDGEVARDHPAFGGRVVHRRNHTREMWGSPDGHGTGVAGIIGSAGENPGMAPGCEIYSYKVFASASAFTGDRFDGEKALQSALEDGVQVANCSWAVPRPAPGQQETLPQVLKDCWEGGMVVVKSAGNSGIITYPGEADDLIVVGTTTPDGLTVPPESGRSSSLPHVVAPGGAPGHEVSSLLVGGGFGPIGWGTSFAAPLVSGAVALLVNSDPSLSPGNMRDRIVSTAVQLADGEPRLDLSSW